VPIREILDADTGLGHPAGYRDSLLEPPAPRLSERDTRLLALAQNAALTRSIEVALDDHTIADLAADDLANVHWQPHTELSFRIHAPTTDALDRGQFDLAVVGVFRAAGTTTGRFLDLLAPGDRERVSRAYSRLPTTSDDALPVQVSSPPLYTRTENVTRSPAVLPYTVSVAEHRTPGGELIPLDDLAVIGDAQRLYLWSRSRWRPVEPAVLSAVEFTNFAHPLLRFPVFAADSAAASAQRTCIARPEAAHQLAVTAASLVDLTVSLLGDVGGGLRWLIDHVTKDPSPAPAREVHDHAIRLANPRDRRAAVRALPGGEHIATTWARRRTALAAGAQPARW